MGRIISIASGKGGVGKTTITANLGAHLTRLDKKVIVIDTDFGLRNLDIALGLENRILYNLSDVLEGFCRWRQALIPSPGFPKLYMIPGSNKIHEPVDFKDKLKILTTDLRKEFDYVLLDCPAGIGNVCKACFQCSQEILLVTNQNITAIHDAVMLLEYVNRTAVQARKSFILNRLPTATFFHKKHTPIDAISDFLEIPFLGSIYEEPFPLTREMDGMAILKNNRSNQKQFQMICEKLMNIPSQKNREKHV